MQDREPQVGREGRVRITQDDGTIIEGVLEMADNATIQGTPYNKATQLSDAVAQALKLTPVEDATVNDALGLLPGLISDLNNVQLAMLTIESGEYTGNGKYGSANPNSLTFSFVPDVVFISSVTNSQSASVAQAILYPKLGATYQRSLLGPQSSYYTIGAHPLTMTMSGNTITWYCYEVGSSTSGPQLNESGITYKWYAIGQKFDNTVTVSCKNSSGALQDGCVVTLGENDPVVSNSTEPLVFKTVSSAPVLTVVSPIDYGGVVQTQTLDLSNTQNLSVDVTVDTSTHLTSGTINASVSGAFSSQVTSVDVFCLGGGGNGAPGAGGQTCAGTGGAGGGGALKSNMDVSGQIVTMIPGGRSGTSSVMLGNTTVCKATGGQAGLSSFESTPTPGQGLIGDSLMTGATPGSFHQEYSYSGSYTYITISALAQPVNGNVVDPFSSQQCSGAGGGHAGGISVTGVAVNGDITHNAVQGGGAYSYPDSEDASVPGGGGGGTCFSTYYGYPQYPPTAGQGQPGYVKWRVAQ